MGWSQTISSLPLTMLGMVSWEPVTGLVTLWPPSTILLKSLASVKTSANSSDMETGSLNNCTLLLASCQSQTMRQTHPKITPNSHLKLPWRMPPQPPPLKEQLQSTLRSKLPSMHSMPRIRRPEPMALKWLRQRLRPQPQRIPPLPLQLRLRPPHELDHNHIEKLNYLLNY